MAFYPPREHLDVLVPLIEKCSGAEAIASLGTIYEHIAAGGMESINTIAFIFSAGQDAGIHPSLCLSCGFILKSILRKIQSDRTEFNQDMVEAQNISNIGDASLSRELLCSMMQRESNNYRLSHALHEAVRGNTIFHTLLLKAIGRSDSTGLSPIQKNAASVIAEYVRIYGLHSFAGHSVFQSSLASIRQYLQLDGATVDRADIFDNITRPLRCENILLLLCCKICLTTSHWTSQQLSTNVRQWLEILQDMHRSHAANSPEANFLSHFLSTPDDCGVNNVRVFIGHIHLLVVLLEEMPIEILCRRTNFANPSLDFDASLSLLEAFMGLLLLPASSNAQKIGIDIRSAYLIADIALNGVLLLMNGRRIEKSELEKASGEHSKGKELLVEQILTIENSTNWSFDQLLPYFFSAVTFSSDAVDILTQALIRFFMECLTAENRENVGGSLWYSLEKNACAVFIEILSFNAAASSSPLFLSHLGGICKFLLEKIERILALPDNSQIYSLNSMKALSLNRPHDMELKNADAIISIASVSLDFFLSLLETQVGLNALGDMLPDVIPIAMTLLAFTSEELQQEFDSTSDDYRIADHSADIKRQPIIRPEDRSAAAASESESTQHGDGENESDHEDDEVSQWSLRMSSGLLLDELACTYGDKAVSLIAPEIHARILQFHQSNGGQCQWIALEAALLGFGAISEGAEVCFPDEALLNLAVAALNVARGSIESHTLAQVMAFWSLSKYAPLILENATNPEQSQSLCINLLTETLSSSLVLMQTTESKLVQDAACSCLLAFLHALPKPSESVRSVFSLAPTLVAGIVDTFSICYYRFQMKNKCLLFSIVNELCKYDISLATISADQQSGVRDGHQSDFFDLSLSKFAVHVPDIATLVDSFIPSLDNHGLPDISMFANLSKESKVMLPYMLSTSSYVIGYLFHANASEALSLMGLRWVKFAVYAYIAMGKERCHCQKHREDTDEGVDDIILGSLYVLLAAASSEKYLHRAVEPLFFGRNQDLFTAFGQVLLQLTCSDDTANILRKNTIAEFSMRFLASCTKSYAKHGVESAPLVTTDFRSPFHFFAQIERKVCGSQLANDGQISVLRMLLILSSKSAALCVGKEGESEFSQRVFLSALKDIPHVIALQKLLNERWVQNISDNMLGIAQNASCAWKTRVLACECIASFGTLYANFFVPVEGLQITEIVRLLLSEDLCHVDLPGLFQIMLAFTQRQAKHLDSNLGSAFFSGEFVDLLLRSASKPADDCKDIVRFILDALCGEGASIDGLDVQALAILRRNFRTFLMSYYNMKGKVYCVPVFEKVSEFYGVPINL